MSGLIYTCTGCPKKYEKPGNQCGECGKPLRPELLPPRDYIPGKPGGGMLDILADGFRRRPLAGNDWAAVKTDNPASQELVDIVNHLHDMFYRYRQKRFQNEMNPDFSRVRWYLGMEEKRAIGSCSHCIDLKEGPDGLYQGAKLLGIPVYWVQADSHVALAEVEK